ncbi:MAG: formate dehydrogenase subunit gamma [Steroidobacteraceae bacterium]
MTEPESRVTLVRYTANQRTNHWVIAITFVLAALSGLALFHPALYWFSALFGGGTWTRILHPFIGLVMTLAFVFLLASVWRDNRMQARDWKWLRQLRDVMANREEGLPEVGRYNAGQKLLFYVMIASMLGLHLSGIVIWRQYFSEFFSLGTIRLASLLHALLAFVLICAIILHIYAAIWVKGSMQAMTRGSVTAGWAWKHHRAWFREMMTHATSSRTRPD